MPKILIVDDEELIRDLFVKFLTRTGFETIPASGGEEAILLLNTDTTIDLILLDMAMPKVSGFEVLKHKAVLKNTCPVILLTGNITKDRPLADLAAYGLRAEDILYKPVDLFILLELIKKKLSN